jgi:predicted ABC-type transport system involved in lysophospholipase L1 biosynthesis ATPase subunit
VSLPSDNPVLDVRGLVFPADGSVLRQVRLAVGEGETVAVLGPQGAGKSVLRACLAGELHPASGTVWTNGKPFHLMSPEDKLAFRLRHYGLVYQDTVFLPELTLADNVALPLRFAGVGAARARQRALTWLARFEIAEAADVRLTGLPLDLVRRAALARAMVNDPLLVLADEPFTGLSSQSADTLGRVLNSIALSHGTAVLLFTGDPATAARCQRAVNLVAGRTSAEPVPIAAPTPAAVSATGPGRVKAAR